MNVISRVALLVSSLAVVVFGILAYQSMRLNLNQSVIEAVDKTSPESPWRLTKNGWEDSRAWRDIQAESKALPPSVHPLLWSLGVLMLSLGAMIWSSDDDAEEAGQNRRNQNRNPED